MSCTARIRLFRPVNDVELACEQPDGHDGAHASTLRDYAYPGSATVVRWQEADRRTFHGDWPGGCADIGSVCTLPSGHAGRCAS